MGDVQDRVDRGAGAEASEANRGRSGFACLFIAHGLGAVKHLSDTVAAMHLGRIVEIAPGRRLFDGPRHACERVRVSALPVPDAVRERARQRIILSGDMPSAADPHHGCRFQTRCPVGDPPLARAPGEHLSWCWRADELDALMPLAGSRRTAPV